MRMLIFLLFSTPSFAQIVDFGKAPETLIIPYGGPTLVRFPAEVRTISRAKRFTIHAADPKQPNFTLLAITPRITQGADDVNFILTDDRVLHARLVILKKPLSRKTDSFYEVKAQEKDIDRSPNPSSPASPNEKLSELELLRAIVNNKKLRGFQVNRLSKDIDLGISGITCRLIESYIGSDLNAYVFELRNIGDKSVHVNLAKLSLESDTEAVLSEIDRENLSKAGTEGGQTLLRVVTKNEVIEELLPFAPLEPGTK